MPSDPRDIACLIKVIQEFLFTAREDKVSDDFDALTKWLQITDGGWDRHASFYAGVAYGRAASQTLVEAVLEAADGGYYRGLTWDTIVTEARKLKGGV
jgi:hypothetical protein